MTEPGAGPPPPDYDPLAEERVSGPVRYAGGRLVEWSDGYARIESTVSDTLRNRLGYVHGGFFMILLDTVGGYAGVYCPYPGRYRRCVTVSMNTTFISGASEGALISEGRVTGGGRRLFFADMTIKNDAGALIASASGVFRWIGGSADLWGDPRAEAD